MCLKVTTILGLAVAIAIVFLSQPTVELPPLLRPLNRTVSKTCNAWLVAFDEGRVICLCNKEVGCGKLEFDWPSQPGQAKLALSSKAGYRFKVSNLPSTARNQRQSKLSADQNDQTTVKINFKDQRQSIVGWGGAFTDSTGINLKKLSPDLAQLLMESYFGEDGLQYNYGRVPIGGADFSPRAYTYDDSTEPDFELKNWSLANEDIQFKIPYIKMAMEIVANNSKQSGANELKLFGSPWSPPKWMKTNKNFVRGFLVDKDQVYRSYTEYLMQFYQAYEENGINFWGATIQNEPIIAYWPGDYINSLQMGDEQMIKFVGQYLGPALVKQGKTRANFKLMVGDDSLGYIDEQVPRVLADLECQKYIAGLAFHWYASNSNSSLFDSLPKVYEAVKDKIEFVLMTEACNGYRAADLKVDLGSWERGEAYAADIIEDLSRRSGGWIDWNLALDLGGGPNWANNFVDSAVIINGPLNEFYMQPMYYALAHFSRFFRPGSIVLGSEIQGAKSTTNDDSLLANITASSVLNHKSGHLIVNIVNKFEDKKTVNIVVEGITTSNPAAHRKLSDGTYKLELDAKSISSLVIKL